MPSSAVSVRRGAKVDKVPAKSGGPLKFSARAKTKALVPFWKVCVGAGRANEGLRSGWREQLRLSKEHCDFQYIRFHGLLHDDMFVCQRKDGKLVFNWQYIDDLFDSLLETGVRPFVEFGFFPKDLAGESDVRTFWWQAHVTPPDDYGDWSILVENMVRHWISRYGQEEVRQWYFECWNEPNLHFFFNSTRTKYFELYRATVLAVKKVDSTLRVGGPATSNFVPDDRFDGEKEDRSLGMTHKIKNLADGKWRGVWIPQFLEFCSRENLPVDFLSTHPYPTDYAFDAGGEIAPRTRPADATVKDLEWLRRTIDQSPFPKAEIHLTEYSSSPSLRDFTHDFPQGATYILKTNVEGSGKVDSLSFWTFTDIVEEHGAGPNAFHGGFGLITLQGVAKPTFHAYRFLNQLTTDEIFRAEGLLATRTADNHVRAVVYHHPDGYPDAPPLAFTTEAAWETLRFGSEKIFSVQISDLSPSAPYLIETVDAEHGFALRQWQEMGSPCSPTRFQIAQLKDYGWATRREIVKVDGKGNLRLELKLAPWAIALIREME